MWLFLCITARKTFCYYCRRCSKKGLISNSNIDPAFVNKGFNNWHECFKQHAKSVSQETMMKVSQMPSPTIDTQLSYQVQQAKDLHFKLSLVLSSLKFLLRQ